MEIDCCVCVFASLVRFAVRFLHLASLLPALRLRFVISIRPAIMFVSPAQPAVVPCVRPPHAPIHTLSLHAVRPFGQGVRPTPQHE